MAKKMKGQLNPKPKGNPRGGTSNEGLGSGKTFTQEEASHLGPSSYPKNGKAQTGE